VKIVELLNNITLPITNEESAILDQFDDNQVILKADLDARSQLIANQLVNKDVLSRAHHNGKVVYRKKI